MGLKKSKTGKHNGTINFLCSHYAKRLHKYLKRNGYQQAGAWKNAYVSRFRKYMSEADYGVNEGKFTSYLNIYSGLAAYEILRENGFSKKEGIAAYDFMCLPMRKLAAALYKIADTLPNGYKTVVKSLTDDLNGPKTVCWTTEIVENSDRKFEYKIHTCLYYDVCREHGYSEFTTVFCNHDHWAFDVLHKQVRFERIGAIGDGDTCCPI